jgi:hypothetical protein
MAGRSQAVSAGMELTLIRDEFETVYDFLAEGAPKSAGLDGRSAVAKVLVTEIREELKDRGFLDCDETGKVTPLARQHFCRAKTQLLTLKVSRELSRGKFVERGGKIWRIYDTENYKQTQGLNGQRDTPRDTVT